MHDSTEAFGGVDWATDTHAVCVVDGTGGRLAEFDVENTAAGLAELCRRVGQTGAVRVAIERPDGPVVDALIDAGFEVVVVSSRSVKALRERYGTSGNKSDRGDAFVLADCLRTDGHRWATLEPDSPPTVTLRAHVRTRKDLVETRVRTANQLRAYLRVVFPGAVGLFQHIDSPISLRFLERFPSATKAQWLNEERLADWLKKNHYPGGKDPAALYQHLTQAAPGSVGEDGDARSGVTIALVNILTSLRAEIDELKGRIEELLNAHPDAHIFKSLPRAGTIRAATLLAEIGDCRARYPDPESLCCIAGVAPSTRASGRHHVVTFRWSSNKQLRNALCDFAGDTMRASPWAEHRYRTLRADGKAHPHAERILARSWTHIIWRCWQDGIAYDPTRHRAAQNLAPSPTKQIAA